MSDPEFSIVSVYNDEEVLNEWLLEGVEAQEFDDYELIAVDNTENRFNTAAAGLNHGANQASGKYLVFIHQDVRLLGADWFKRAKTAMEKIPDVGVAGVSGVTDKGIGKNIIYHGLPPEELNVRLDSDLPDPRKKTTLNEEDILSIEAVRRRYPAEIVRPLTGGTKIDMPEPVQSLDELLAIVPSKVFSEEQFDPSICDGWHLYVVEYCLRINNRTQYQAYTLPLNVWHRSLGMELDRSFYRILEQMISEYKTDLDDHMLHTPTGTWPTDRLFLAVNRRWPGTFASQYYILFRQGLRKPHRIPPFLVKRLKEKVLYRTTTQQTN